MTKSKNFFHITLFNSIVPFLGAIALIGFLWFFFIGLNKIGVLLPLMDVGKFQDLGFFATSTFGLIVFLTMIPFQTVAGQLSGGFLSRVFNTPAAHFGLYVLLISTFISFFVNSLKEFDFVEANLNALFLAIIVTIVFSIVFHRFWVIRYLYQPYVVYKHIKSLSWEESGQRMWVELYECLYKAIVQGRVSDAHYFIALVNHFFENYKNSEHKDILYEDLFSLRTAAQNLRPVARFMEKKWPFLSEVQIPEEKKLKISLNNDEKVLLTNDKKKESSDEEIPSAKKEEKRATRVRKEEERKREGYP